MSSSRVSETEMCNLRRKSSCGAVSGCKDSFTTANLALLCADNGLDESEVK